MKADRASVTWDAHKKEWNVRIHIGEEVIKRVPKEIGSKHDIDEEALRSTALEIAKDDGYDLDPSHVTVTR